MRRLQFVCLCVEQLNELWTNFIVIFLSELRSRLDTEVSAWE